MQVAKLTDKGTGRTLDGNAGMTFVVDHFTTSSRGMNAHVRDYRYPNVHREFQVWTLSPDQYELIEN